MKNREKLQSRKSMLIAKSEAYRYTLAIEFARIKSATLSAPNVAHWVRKLGPAFVGAGVITFLLFGKKFRFFRWFASRFYLISQTVRLTNTLLNFMSRIRKITPRTKPNF